MPQVRVTALSAIISSAVLAIVGCHSKTSATPENYLAALNAKFLDHPQCLMPDAPHFPYETTDPEMTRKMDALVTAQLLEVKKGTLIHVSRYTTTVLGGIAAPRFCYGHREATSIDNSTPAAVANGFPETQVTYHYIMKDVPVWAKTPAVEAAFPEMAKAIAGPLTDKATVAKTMAGWSVPD
jgi:hypothetical protein